MPLSFGCVDLFLDSPNLAVFEFDIDLILLSIEGEQSFGLPSLEPSL